MTSVDYEYPFIITVLDSSMYGIDSVRKWDTNTVGIASTVLSVVKELFFIEELALTVNICLSSFLSFSSSKTWEMLPIQYTECKCSLHCVLFSLVMGSSICLCFLYFPEIFLINNLGIIL